MKVMFNPKLGKEKYLALCDTMNTLLNKFVSTDKINYRTRILTKLLWINKVRYKMIHYNVYIDLYNIIKNEQIKKSVKINAKVTAKDLFPPLSDIHYAEFSICKKAAIG